jgi:hypothetical protein
MVSATMASWMALSTEVSRAIWVSMAETRPSTRCTKASASRAASAALGWRVAPGLAQGQPVALHLGKAGGASADPAA